MNGLHFVECPSGKVPHLSEDEAKGRAWVLNNRPDNLGVVDAYLCRRCKQWHTGRINKKALMERAGST